jgi:hypothetical protein
VMDGVGRITFQDEESCFDPITKVTFQGCGVARARSAPFGWLVMASMLALTWRAKRRAGSARS